MQDGSPLDFDNWESQIGRDQGHSIENTAGLEKTKQAYLDYVKSVKAK